MKTMQQKQPNTSTVQDILGRDPSDQTPHYKINSAIDAGMGSSREDTKKLRKGNFTDLRKRNKG
jgi:mannitol-specific phosphotransferase system IIBC component